jgi:malonate transporter and related proteins
MDIVLTLLPDFALILTGAWAKRALHWTGATWAGLERLIYYFLLPALLFLTTATAQFGLAQSGSVALAALGLLLLGFALSVALWPAVTVTYSSFASGLQCGYRFNSFIGLALAGKLYGAGGAAMLAVMIGACVPIANIRAVGALARGRDESVLSEIMKNPLLLATVAGSALNLFDLAVPLLLKDYLQRLSNASIGVGLLAVGAAMVWRLPTRDRFFVTAITAIKLIALPLIALALAHWLRLDPVGTGVLVLYAALPTATSAHVLAARLGGNGELTATMVTVSTLTAMFTLPVWVVWTHLALR